MLSALEVIGMAYTVHELSELSGVTPRTLRFYDKLGLLSPSRDKANGYRLYDSAHVDLLQQILIYRELGLELTQIKQLVTASDFDRAKALHGHLRALEERREQLGRIIDNVQKTLASMKGETTMNDKEKFEGFKRELQAENESKYGAEIRAAYGDPMIDDANKKLGGMSQEQWERQETLSKKLLETLKAAKEQGDPNGALAREACGMHKEWLCMFWPEGSYSKKAHLGLAQMYAADERFRAYYDNAVGEGATDFLLQALTSFLS